MTIEVIEGGNPRQNFTSTGTIKGSGSLLGVFVSSASATPTLKLADASGNIANTFTPSGGTYYKMPCAFSGDLTVTISGTVDCTVFYAI